MRVACLLFVSLLDLLQVDHCLQIWTIETAIYSNHTIPWQTCQGQYNKISQNSFGPNTFSSFIQTSAHLTKKVQVGKDQEKAQSEKDPHSKNRGGKKKQTNNQALIP